MSPHTSQLDTDEDPACPNCKTNVLTARYSAAGDEWVCYGCGAQFNRADVPYSLRRGC